MNKILVGAKALIVKGDKFLVIKEDSGGFIFWDLPGGKIDYGEPPYETIKREIREELFVEVNVENPIGVFYIKRRKDDAHVVNIIFKCSLKSEKFDIAHNPAQDENILEFKWITKKEFLNEKYVVYHPSLKEEINKINI